MTFNGIQTLRGVAAMLVVLFHAQGLCSKYASGPSPSGELMRGLGVAGVDLFFVISGFVIYLAASKDPSPKSFLIRRLIRIAPVYWLMTLAYAALPLALPSLFSGPAPDKPMRLAQSLSFVSFLSGGWPILYVGWSLEYEMIFYLLAAAALCAKLEVRRVVPFALIAIYCCAETIPLRSAGFLNIFSQSMIFEFALGLYAASLRLKGRLDPIDAAQLAAILLAVTAVGTDTRLFTFGLPSALIVLILAGAAAGRPARLLKLPGDASYSIYLIQVFTLPVAGKIFRFAFFSWQPEVLVWFAFSFTLASGVLFHLLVEAPLSRVLRAAFMGGGHAVMPSMDAGRGRRCQHLKAPDDVPAA